MVASRQLVSELAVVYTAGISQTGIASMTRSTVFKTNRTQAVRLPKAVAFPDDVREVEIVKRGQTLVISPAGRNWEDYFQHGAKPPDDFMTERVQPSPDEREPL
jgi:antitoxin VapB